MEKTMSMNVNWESNHAQRKLTSECFIKANVVRALIIHFTFCNNHDSLAILVSIMKEMRSHVDELYNNSIFMLIQTSMRRNSTLITSVCHEHYNIFPISMSNACINNKNISFIIDACKGRKCKNYGVCKANPLKKKGYECVCRECTTMLSPVCGSDKRTYKSECFLKRTSCRKNIKVYVTHPGPCGRLQLQ